jgi:hypothetical protein
MTWNRLWWVFLTLITEAVSPAALLPLPEVYTPTGDTFSMNFRNCGADAVQMRSRCGVEADA